MHFRIYADTGNNYRWRLISANGRTIADSGEGYQNKGDCLGGIQLVKGCQNASILDATTSPPQPR